MVVRMVMKSVWLIIQQVIKNSDFTVFIKMIVMFFKYFALHYHKNYGKIIEAKQAYHEKILKDLITKVRNSRPEHFWEKVVLKNLA